MSQNKIKKLGQVYTPEYLVKLILDEAGYVSGNILKQHIIDNSFGDGAFLVEIVKRYISDAKLNNYTDLQIKADLQTYIHGIEIDNEAYQIAKSRLNEVFQADYDLRNANTLNVSDLDGKMDFVVGNPPYIRVHNLGADFERVKSFSFVQKGMIDLYIVFYEIGIRMLNKTGVLAYVSPSSWWTSIAGKGLREFLIENKILYKIIDLGHFQPFPKIMTYTAIVVLDSKQHESITFSSFNGEKVTKIDELSLEILESEGNFYFSDKKSLEALKKIKNYSSSESFSVRVKNGFATLADKTFLNTKDLNSPYIIDAVKATTGKWHKMIFPYDSSGKIIEETLFKKDMAYSRLKLDYEQLSKNPPWYGYGRSQAIKDVQNEKMSINSTIVNVESLRITKVPKGFGVYGGLYIVGFSSEQQQKIVSILETDEFMNYVRSLRKYRSGGYYTFSSKDLQKFLEYKLGE